MGYAMIGRRWAMVLIATFLLSAVPDAWRARGQEGPWPAPTAGSTGGGSSTSRGPPVAAPGLDDAQLQDPAFERFLDPRLLARAWERQDAASLTDMALLLAEGERVLLRSHKAFRPDHLLELAAYVAADLDDHATLERLARAAEARKDAALADLVKQADQLMATPTADRHDWASDIESISRHSLSVHQATLRHIRVIRICGDQESLDELKKAIQALPDLTPTQKAHALKAIADHSKNIKKSNPALRPTIHKLDRLARIYPPTRPTAGPLATADL